MVWLFVDYRNRNKLTDQKKNDPTESTEALKPDDVRTRMDHVRATVVSRSSQWILELDNYRCAT